MEMQGDAVEMQGDTGECSGDAGGRGDAEGCSGAKPAAAKSVAAKSVASRPAAKVDNGRPTAVLPSSMKHYLFRRQKRHTNALYKIKIL